MEKYSRGWRGAPAKGVDRLFPVRGFKSLFLRFFKKDKRYFEDEADFWFYCLDREKAFGHAVNLLQWIRNFFEVKIQIIRYVLWAPFERQIRRVFFLFYCAAASALRGGWSSFRRRIFPEAETRLGIRLNLLLNHRLLRKLCGNYRKIRPFTNTWKKK